MTDQFDEEEAGLDPDQQQILNDYLIFSNGAGYNVLKDILETFHELHNEALLDELSEIPHPYREYTIKGMRMVTQKIKDTVKIAERNRGISDG